ncbi:MAG: hypothetical protein MZV70_57650 [Desulfobacterales bacterium]|nr:hypothetical protein [Desulfobacterales bacterium]
MKRTEILQEIRKMRFEEAIWWMAERTIKPGRSSGDIGGMQPDISASDHVGMKKTGLRG